MEKQIKGILLASCTSCLWGVLGIALKVALIYFDAYTIVWFRFFIAFSCLFVYFSITSPDVVRVIKRPPWLMVLAGIFLAANYIGYMRGVELAGPGTAQLVIQTGSILLAAVGFIFFKEKLSHIRAMGFIIAGMGFALFYSYQLSSLAGDIVQSESYIKGILWVLFASFTWTAYAVINKKLVQVWPSQQVNLIVFGLPVLLFLPIVDLSLFLRPYPWWVWLLIIGLGLNTVVAYGMLAASFKYAEANRISTVITLNPVITFILLEIMLSMDVKWFEITPMPVMAFAGAALVIVGAIVAVGNTKN